MGILGSNVIAPPVAAPPADIHADFREWPLVIIRPPERVLSDAEFRAYLEWTQTHLLTRHVRYAVVLDNRKTPPITASQRKMMADRMNAMRAYNTQYCAATAIVFDSALMRGVMTAILWLATPPYPTKVFADLDEAVRWTQSALASERGAQTG